MSQTSSIEEPLDKYLEGFSEKELKIVRSLIQDPQAASKIKKLEDSIYRVKPPTPMEFLDKWLGDSIRRGLYPHVIKMFCDIWDHEKDYHETVLYGCTRCEAKNTKILMYDLNIKRIQNIKIGDLLMGDDSFPRRVISLHKGYGDLYKVTPCKNNSYIVNENHLLTLQFTNRRTFGEDKRKYRKEWYLKDKIIDIPVSDYLKLSKNRKHILKGLQANLDFSEDTTIKIDPYFIGLWNGDGDSARLTITSMGPEIKEYLYSFIKKEGGYIREEYNKKRNKAIRYCLTTKEKSLNTLFKRMKFYNLIYNKHIPLCYIKNSREVRLQVLAGLLDSDGHNDRNGCYEIILKNKKLAFGVVLLSRSLGFGASIKRVKKGIKSINFIGKYYRIIIRGSIEIIPVKIKRKKILNKKNKFNPLRTGIKVSYYGKGDFYGFEIDGNHRYLHSDLTITHNSGKSACARLSILYCVVWLWCLRDPHAYYGLNKMSSLAIYLMCFSKKKAEQLLLKPIMNLLKNSPKFHQVLFSDKIDSVQKKLGTEKIVWSTASQVGSLSFAGDLHICLGSDPMDIIGADIVMAMISEINFFMKVAGITEEDVWKVYTEVKDRIEGTVARKYGSMLILDSSANNRDSIIEDYALNKAAYDPKVYFKQFARWEAVPERFPIWQKTKQTFKVFKGDTTRVPRIVDESFKFYKGDERLIIDVPIDAKDTFEKDIYGALRAVAGVPTGSELLFFPNLEAVKVIFDDNLENVTRSIPAPISSPSEDLIMNEIRHVFMWQDISGKWILKRAKTAPRWVRVDLSEKSDRTGVAMIHPEIRDDGSVIGVYDFLFDISPGKDGINLDSVLYFIRSLYLKYGVYVAGVSSDKYQSSFIAQAIKKDEKEYRLISVDGSKTPYLVFKSKVLNGTIKVGYYLNILNNLKSLIELPERIDHTQSKKDSKELKEVGLENKDLTDAASGSCFDMFSEVGKYQIKYNYDDINRTILISKQYQEGGDASKMDRLQLYDNLMKNIVNKDGKIKPSVKQPTF